MLTQEDKMNVTIIKKTNVWKEYYIFIPPESRLKNVKVETKKLNKLLTRTTIGNISKLKKLINSRAKPVYKIGVSQRKLKRKRKPVCELKLAGQAKKLRPQAKTIRKEKENTRWCFGMSRQIADKLDHATWRD